MREFVDPFRMHPGGFYTTMDKREAQLILGVGAGDNNSVIKQRHRILMLNNHPDNGGSTYIATKINQAKQILLN